MRVKLQDLLTALKSLSAHDLNQDMVLLDDNADEIPIDFGRDPCSERMVFFTVEENEDE
jgi:hypothetical protein